jgi:hypothetical protein
MPNAVISLLFVTIPLVFSQASSAEERMPLRPAGHFVATGNYDESLEFAFYLHCPSDRPPVEQVEIVFEGIEWTGTIAPVQKQLTLNPGEGGTLLVPFETFGSAGSVQFTYTLRVAGILNGYTPEQSNQNCELLGTERVLEATTGKTRSINIRPLHDRVIVRRVEEEE